MCDDIHDSWFVLNSVIQEQQLTKYKLKITNQCDSFDLKVKYNEKKY